MHCGSAFAMHCGSAFAVQPQCIAALLPSTPTHRISPRTKPILNHPTPVRGLSISELFQKPHRRISGGKQVMSVCVMCHYFTTNFLITLHPMLQSLTLLLSHNLFIMGSMQYFSLICSFVIILIYLILQVLQPSPLLSVENFIPWLF